MADPASPSAETAGAASKRAPHGPALLERLRGYCDEMAELLAELARAESPSAEPAAQARTRELLAGELESAGLRVDVVPGRSVGDHLLARRSHGRDPVPLVLGHLDTVWPLGTIEEMPVHRRGDLLHGPGTYDMKGGLVQLAFALRALGEVGARPGVTVFVGADEEIGSPDSRHHVGRLAAEASCALVLEPSFGPVGALKTARKGVGRFRVSIRGQASHAGIEPERGVSAILELSRQVERLFELNEQAAGVTVNVGTIDGGMGANVVAPEAGAIVEARVPTVEQADRLTGAIESLEPTQEGCSIEVSGGFDRPPLEHTDRNRRLWGRALAAAEGLGIDLEEAAVGGASDGNLASAHTATLDGLGAVGDGAHAPEEHVVIARMPERAALLAMLLLDPEAGR
jgi:glutamate carboxypeptidase